MKKACGEGKRKKSRPGEHPVFLAVFNHSLESQSELAKIVLRNKSAMFVIHGNEYGVINGLLGQCRAASLLSRPQTGNGWAADPDQARKTRAIPPRRAPAVTTGH